MNPESEIQDSESNDFHSLAKDGFEILTDFFPPEKCEVLADQLSALQQRQRENAGNRLGGLRNLLQVMPEVSELAKSSSFKSVLKDRLGETVFPVRALFFDKTPDANWSVAWHQDLSIAVAERIETPGFEAWSVKEGVVHVQPPCEVLENMVTVRLHLDDCTADNGPLKVIPGSHLKGKLRTSQIADWTRQNKASICEVPKGGALLMRPLLLHSSSPARLPLHRRVLHIEFASVNLPNGLEWFERQ